MNSLYSKNIVHFTPVAMEIALFIASAQRVDPILIVSCIIQTKDFRPLRTLKLSVRFLRVIVPFYCISIVSILAVCFHSPFLQSHTLASYIISRITVLAHI
uniref:Uncharacterized protein n=1 Tax=Arundo donax TaxID=35708 RepID=A0A0A9GP87_ARUDO